MTINVGLIGLNYGGQVHLPTFKAHPKYQVLAVCARTPGRAEAVAKEYNISRWYTDARALLQMPELDLVSIATPSGTHAGLAAAALALGKHVVSEVGFVPEAREARVLATVAREHARVGAVAYVLRYSPLLRHITDLLSQKALGTIRLMRFESFSSFLAAPNQSLRWMLESKSGGGILLNFTAHAINLAQKWLGPVQEVDGSLKTFASVTGSSPSALADDTGVATLYFESGALAVFTHSAVTAHTRTRFELHGAQASLIAEGFGDEANLIRMEEGVTAPLYANSAYLEESIGQSGLLGGFRVFLDKLAIPIEARALTPDMDLPTFAEAWETACVLDAIRKAARERRRVKLSEIEVGWQVK